MSSNPSCAVLAGGAMYEQMASTLSAPFACRLRLYCCDPGDASAAVSMLQRLPLSSSALEVHAHDGTEEDYNYPNLEAYGSWVQIPPLAALGGTLTELSLHGACRLPPDWRALHSLRSLQVVNYDSLWVDWGEEEEPDWFCWGNQPLTTLMALSSFDLLGASSETRNISPTLPGEALCCGCYLGTLPQADAADALQAR